MCDVFSSSESGLSACSVSSDCNSSRRACVPLLWQNTINCRRTYSAHTEETRKAHLT